jgi:hypothetical protein
MTSTDRFLILVLVSVVLRMMGLIKEVSEPITISVKRPLVNRRLAASRA